DHCRLPAARIPAFKAETSVLAWGYRNPALTANIAANLQCHTHGRFIVGMGAGGKEDEYRAYGFPSPRRRLRIMELEVVMTILRAMGASSASSYQGKH